MRNKYADHEHYVSRANPTSGRTYNPERNGGALVTYGADGEPISYREVFVDGPPDMREFRPHRWMRGAREVPAMTHTLSCPLAPADHVHTLTRSAKP